MENNNKEKKDEELFNPRCPSCKSSVTLILDPKRYNRRDAEWLCQVCGKIFSPEEKNNSRDKLR
ncbi:hypothetical protein MROS_1018 [Melioribacter roseus P3M-2]|uniref:Uncharacterized protein n=1 Tax=Melioribacter roseus (strain DSM 23840 / JCM 17771 / VKM B-2668 / P3M-2) TaxID=1191523 RepID=I6ZZ12_MELRP|nr:phage terminase large subunit family protein [Melioribacter roseus]AFN74258.1 hypothetical protein MROS_1018 [Melioribacter roseus P3M-2]